MISKRHLKRLVKSEMDSYAEKLVNVRLQNDKDTKLSEGLNKNT